MSVLPDLDFADIWSQLGADVQARIGTLALQEAFLRFASTEFEGHIVYLDTEARADAEAAADEAAQAREYAIQAALPDLFGLFPSDEHPGGTDPAWATPIQIEPGAYVTFEVTDEARFDR